MTAAAVDSVMLEYSWRGNSQDEDDEFTGVDTKVQMLYQVQWTHKWKYIWLRRRIQIEYKLECGKLQLYSN